MQIKINTKTHPTSPSQNYDYSNKELIFAFTLLSKPKLKSKITILLLLLFHLATFSQNLQLKIIGKTKEETKILDSINYTKQHPTLKQLIDEISNTNKKLAEIGYIENQLLENKKESDSNYTAKISLRNKIKNIHIYIGIKKTAGYPKIFQKN